MWNDSLAEANGWQEDPQCLPPSFLVVFLSWRHVKRPHRFHSAAWISLRDKTARAVFETCIRRSGVSLSLGLCRLSSFAKFMMFSPWGLFCIQAGLVVDLGCDLTCVETELLSDVWQIATVNQISFSWLLLASVSWPSDCCRICHFSDVPIRHFWAKSTIRILEILQVKNQNQKA